MSSENHLLSIKHKIQNFSSLIGHKKIKDEFIKRSKDLNFPEVLFFIGDPGSGKTISATIIAKLLNCKNPIRNSDGTQDPCNECYSCKDIEEEKYGRDVHLLNASQMSKDDVNELESLVSYYPSYDKNIVIIVDESHELSKSGLGATKKLLEKKRNNVYFILCTSDFNAFTPEIKRRGQVYLFKNVDDLEISYYLLDIIKKENMLEIVGDSFLSEGIFTLGQNCNGSPGYALSLLERCISGEIYDSKEIIAELGLMSNNLVVDTLEKLIKKDLSTFGILRARDFKLEEFFRKGNKILNETYVFVGSKYIDEEWKIKSFSRLKVNIKNLIDLLEIFNNTTSIPYFSESSFFYQLAKNYFKFEISTAYDSVVEKNISRRRIQG